MDIRNSHELEQALKEAHSVNEWPEYEPAAHERRRRWRKKQMDYGYSRQIRIMNWVITIMVAGLLGTIVGLIIVLAR